MSGTSATWTNTTGSTVTLVFVNSVPLASVFHTAVTQTLVGGAPNTNAYQPANNTSYSFANTGGSMTSTPSPSASGTMTWITTVVVPANTILRLSTQAGPCRATGPSVTVQITSPVVDRPFTYAVDCPF